MTNSKLKRICLSLLLCAGWLVSGTAYAEEGFELDDFRLRSAQDLVDVCTLQPGHEHYDVAIAFCYGFFEGATHYDNALADSKLYADLVCEPDGVTRSQAVAVIMDYLTANTQYGSEAPIDASFRALIDRWPCPE